VFTTSFTLKPPFWDLENTTIVPFEFPLKPPNFFGKNILQSCLMTALRVLLALDTAVICPVADREVS
jgi:hypothetical protein